MTKTLDEFQAERTAANERILSGENRAIKRFFRLDGEAYEDGALPAKTKELLGLVASLVLRCDDCISYHVIQCAKCGVTPAEFEEAFMKARPTEVARRLNPGLQTFAAFLARNRDRIPLG